MPTIVSAPSEVTYSFSPTANTYTIILDQPLVGDDANINIGNIDFNTSATSIFEGLFNQRGGTDGLTQLTFEVSGALLAFDEILPITVTDDTGVSPPENVYFSPKPDDIEVVQLSQNVTATSTANVFNKLYFDFETTNFRGLEQDNFLSVDAYVSGSIPLDSYKISVSSDLNVSFIDGAPQEVFTITKDFWGSYDETTKTKIANGSVPSLSINYDPSLDLSKTPRNTFAVDTGFSEPNPSFILSGGSALYGDTSLGYGNTSVSLLLTPNTNETAELASAINVFPVVDGQSKLSASIPFYFDGTLPSSPVVLATFEDQGQTEYIKVILFEDGSVGFSDFSETAALSRSSQIINSQGWYYVRLSGATTLAGNSIQGRGRMLYSVGSSAVTQSSDYFDNRSVSNQFVFNRFSLSTKEIPIRFGHVLVSNDEPVNSFDITDRQNNITEANAIANITGDFTPGGEIDVFLNGSFSGSPSTTSLVINGRSENILNIQNNIVTANIFDGFSSFGSPVDVVFEFEDSSETPPYLITVEPDQFAITSITPNPLPSNQSILIDISGDVNLPLSDSVSLSIDGVNSPFSLTGLNGIQSENLTLAVGSYDVTVNINGVSQTETLVVEAPTPTPTPTPIESNTMAGNVGRKFKILKNGTAIAGGRTKSFSWSGESIDLTSGEDDGIRLLLPESGQEQIDISVEGVTKSNILQDIVLGGGSRMITDIQIEFALIEDGAATPATLSCNFRISAFEQGAPYNDAITFTATLESSGPWTYTAEA